MSLALSLALAMLLDAAIGEPVALWRRWPHPAVVMGRLVAWLDGALNHSEGRRGRGALALLVLIAAGLGLGLALRALPGQIAEVAVAAALLAQRSLADHVGAVARDLRIGLGDGRLAVARIVSRDTAQMQPPDVARAAIESAAENLSDGVIAPAFWFLIGGLPGLLVYKLVNTADSMIGYRTPQYQEFGWACARFDDLINLIPARLTALMIRAFGAGRWSEIAAEAGRHKSPNAGWPEAAMARALGIALAGPRSYHGAQRAFAFVNPEGRRQIGAGEIDKAVAMLWKVWALALVAAAPLALL